MLLKKRTWTHTAASRIYKSLLHSSIAGASAQMQASHCKATLRPAAPPSSAHPRPSVKVKRPRGLGRGDETVRVTGAITGNPISVKKRPIFPVFRRCSSWTRGLKTSIMRCYCNFTPFHFFLRDGCWYWLDEAM